MNWIETLERTNAILTGHFVLASGRHSERYIQCANAMRNSAISAEASRQIAEHFSGDNVTCVIGLEETGSVLSFLVAQCLGAEWIPVRRNGNGVKWLDGCQEPAASRVLIVDDVGTTGGTLRLMMTLINQCNSEIVGIGLVAQKTEFQTPFEHKTVSLCTIPSFPSFLASECPVCSKSSH
jgi:orotate phosphoribosyltransferase